MSNIVCVYGTFNPLRYTDVEFFQAQKTPTCKLVVLVENDVNLRKKGISPFMPEKERLTVIRNFDGVDFAILNSTSVEATLSQLNPSNLTIKKENLEGTDILKYCKDACIDVYII